MKLKSIFLLLPVMFAALLIGGSLHFSTQAQAAEIAAHAQPNTTFSVTPITNNALTDTVPTVAVDAAGHLHIAYIGDDIVRYLTNTSGTWTSTIVGDSSVELHPSIAVDDSGYAHIAYFSGSASPYELYYVTNAGGSGWTREMLNYVTCPGFDRLDGGIALNNSGSPYIVYAIYDGTDYEIEMRYHDGTRGYAPNGGWTTETITDNASDDDGHPSIAIDNNDQIHIAFDSYTGDMMKDYDIFYTTNGSGSWVQSTAVSQDYSDRDASIAVDEDGKIHIAYYHFEMAGDSIQYATNLNGSWAHEPVADDSNDLYFYPAITLDNNEDVHIAYQTHNNAGHHVSHATNASGSWVNTDMSVTSSENMAATMDRLIAVDQGGYVHIVHSGNAGGDQEIYHAKSDQSFGTGEASTCASPRTIHCGDQVTGDTVGLSNNISSYGCSAWDESGPEEIWAFSLAPGHNYSVTTTLLGISANLDVFLLDPGGCDSGTCLGPNSYGDWGASVDSLPGGNTFYIAIDGREGAQGSYTMELNCDIVQGENFPITPHSPNPADNAADVPLNPILSWQTGDIDGDTITGSVYGSTSNPPSIHPDNLWCSTSSQGAAVTQSCTPAALLPDTPYYWRVEVFDGGEAVEGPVWYFKTGRDTLDTIFLPMTVK